MVYTSINGAFDIVLLVIRWMNSLCTVHNTENDFIYISQLLLLFTVDNNKRKLFFLRSFLFFFFPLNLICILHNIMFLFFS